MSQSFPDDIDVVIVAHNNLTVLPDALTSVTATGCPPSRITVVNIASTDGTSDWLQREWPGVRERTLDVNLGPSPGRNVGIRETTRRFVLLMDADVVLTPSCVTPLHVDMCADARIKVGSPVVVHRHDPTIIQYAGGGMHFICEAINPWLDRPLSARGSAPADIDAAPTCALLLDRAAAIEVGLFDERYFIGKEDGDFTHRVRLAGYIIRERPDALVLHRSRPRGTWLFYYQIRNRWHFMLKNYQWRTLIAIAPVVLVHETLQALLLVAKGHGRVYLRAAWGLLALLPSLRQDRALMRRIRVLPDGALLHAGPLVVRDDLAGHPALRTAKTLYERALTAYWSVLTATVLRP